MSDPSQQQLIQSILGQFYVPNRQYHTLLPQQLAQWYCYTSDGGHNILCVLKQNFKSKVKLEQYLVPIPVKTVLKGYELKDTYVVVDCEYSPEIGLIFDSTDEEF